MGASSSRSRGRSGSLPLKRRSGRYGSTAQLVNHDTLRSIFSRLNDPFDLAHFSAVCNSWATLCRMKSGSILTGMGDKAVVFWLFDKKSIRDSCFLARVNVSTIEV